MDWKEVLAWDGIDAVYIGYTLKKGLSVPKEYTFVDKSSTIAATAHLIENFTQFIMKCMELLKRRWKNPNAHNFLSIKFGIADANKNNIYT